MKKLLIVLPMLFLVACNEPKESFEQDVASNIKSISHYLPENAVIYKSYTENHGAKFKLEGECFIILGAIYNNTLMTKINCPDSVK